MPRGDNYNTKQTVVTIEISPTKIVEKKQNKTNLNKAIISNTCALLNSDGGVLVLDFSRETSSKKAINDSVRIIEQWVKNFAGATTTVSNIKTEVQPHQIVLNIKGYYHLSTVNYNLCLPSVTEVISLPSNEPMEKVREIVEGKYQMSTGDSFGFHETTFIQGQDSGLVESYSVELKQLESSSSKYVTLADRMVAKTNKFTSYVSAFANYSGGNIYFGIKDDGTVEGEKITDEDEIIEKVSKVIKKMVWLGLDGAKKKEQWDIYFEPVKDTKGNAVPATFVIVIAVAKYCHGVFTEEPESYHVVDGEVTRMRLSTWKERLLSDELPGRNQDRVESVDGETRTSGQLERCDVIHSEARNQSGVARFLDRCNWSSQQMQKKYCSLNGILIRKINDGLWKEFERHAKIEETKYTEGDLKSVILSMKITADYKNGKFDVAYRALGEYTSLLNTCKDTIVCEVREFLVRSSLERCQGNHRKSYEIAVSGLAKADQIPAGIIVAEYYANFASIITILLSHECEAEERTLLKHTAISAFRTALEHLKVANEYQPSKIDQEQKVHINLAYLYLGCSFSGDTIEERVDEHAISQAVSSLKVVDQHVYDGFELSNYRESQYILARSGLHYRRSQNVVAAEDPQNTTTRRFLESALKNSKDAEEIAQRCNFDEMLFSSRKFKAICTELLSRLDATQRSHDNR